MMQQSHKASRAVLKRGTTGEMDGRKRVIRFAFWRVTLTESSARVWSKMGMRGLWGKKPANA